MAGTKCKRVFSMGLALAMVGTLTVHAAPSTSGADTILNLENRPDAPQNVPGTYDCRQTRKPLLSEL